MYLLVDGQAIQSPGSGPRGIGRYSRNFVRALARARPDWKIVVVQNGTQPPLSAEERGGLPVLTYLPPIPPRTQPPLLIDSLALNERHYADWFSARGADAVVLLSVIGCEMEAIVPRFGTHRPAVFALLYDLIPLLFPERYLVASWQRDYYSLRVRQLCRMDGLFAISQATADDFARHFPRARPEIVNVRGGIDPDLQPLRPPDLQRVENQLRSRLALEGDFLLYVAGPDWRKNVEGAVRTYAYLPERMRKACSLVVAGLALAERPRRLATQLGVGDQVRFAGYISNDELRALYQTCRLFFCPSRYEGLGLPILEAMSLGAPVVASATSSLPEYAGELSWLADPECPRAMSEAIQLALGEPYESRRSARQAFARSFRWQDTAEAACRLIDACRERRVSPVASRESRVESPKEKTPPARDSRLATRDWLSQPDPPRIAWVTTVEQVRFGPYAIDLIGELAGRCELLLALDRPEQLPADLAAQARIVSWSDLNRLVEQDPFDLMVVNPGENGPEELWAFARSRTCVLALGEDCVARARAEAAGLGKCLAVVVPSDEAASELADAVTAPVEVIPLGLPALELASRAHLRLKRGKSLALTLVGTFVGPGDVDPFHRLCQSLAQLPARFRSRFELIILEHARPEEMYSLHLAAQKSGVAHYHFLSHPDQTTAREVMATCDLWVQPGSRERDRIVSLQAMAVSTGCLVAGSKVESPERRVESPKAPAASGSGLSALDSPPPSPRVGWVGRYGWEVEGLAQAFRQHAEQSHLREVLAVAGRQWVRRCHRLEQSMQRWADLIDRAVAWRVSTRADWSEAATTALAAAPQEPALSFASSWAELHEEARVRVPALLPRMRPESRESRADSLKSRESRADSREPERENPSGSGLSTLDSRLRRLWVDVSYIATQHRGRFIGICRTVVSILRELLARPELPLHFCVFTPEPTPHLRPIIRDQLEHLLANGSWVTGGEPVRVEADDRELELGPTDMLFLPELCVVPPYCQLLRELKASRGVRIVQVVYDMIGCREPQFLIPCGFSNFWNWAVCMIEVSDLVLAISESTKRDIHWFAKANRLPEPRVEVFRLGDSELYLSNGSSQGVGGLTESDRFVLMVSTIEVRKNHRATYQTWHRLCRKHGKELVPYLVYVGGQGWLTENLSDLIRSDPTVRDKILWMSNLGEDDLAWLYRHCLFTVYPSHYEGWGLPIAESLSFGKYCIASNSSSMPEIGGALVDYHDPTDQARFEELVERALFDHEYRVAREEQIRAQYRPTTWAESATQVVHLWEKVLGRFTFPVTEPCPARSSLGRHAA